MTLLERPLFYIGHHYVTLLGLIAFAGFFGAGLIIARFLQSRIVRFFFSRFKIDTNFIVIVTTILSLAAIVFFTVTAVNAAGIPLAWSAPLPAINLSLVQIDCGKWRSPGRSEEHTSELQSLRHLVCRLLLEKKTKVKHATYTL